MIIEFPEFAPDLPALNNPGLTVATNVRPIDSTYKPVNSLAAYSDALSDYARGAYSGRVMSTGASFNFFGDGTKLYRMVAAAQTDVSKAGNYALAADDRWFFTQFGSRVLATTFTAVPQSYVLESSALFADLAGTPPQARYIATVRDFVFLANTYDAIDGNVPVRVRWCGIGDPTLWTVSAVTQADYQDLDSTYGWVTQVVSGEYAVVFQERAISRFDYVGSPVVFQFNTVETGRGTRFPSSTVKVGNLIYYIGHDGFYVFDGHRSTDLGDERVDDFFFANVDLSYDYRVNGNVDYDNNLIIWAFPTSGATSGRPNRLIYFSYAPKATKRWGYAEIDTELLASTYTEGYTLDQLDAWQAAQTPPVVPGDIDVLPYSLDSPFWTGKTVVLGAFDATHRLSYFGGDALTAVIETAEVQLTEGQRSDLFRVKPLVEGSLSANAITVQIGTRNRQSGSGVSYASAVTLDVNGDAQVRASAFFYRMRVTISGGFTQAQGFEVLEFQAAGNR